MKSFPIKPQPTAVRPHLYRALSGAFGAEHTVIAEETSLRGLVARLHVLRFQSATDVAIEADIHSWHLPITVPPEVYSVRQDREKILYAPEVVPEHWDFPAAYSYFALDWKRGLYVDAPTLTELVAHLHAAGCTFVDSEDMKIGARFAREDGGADDVARVPLSLLCHGYEDSENDAWDDESGSEEEGGDVDLFYPTLPPQAELLPIEMIEPHFLFARELNDERRWKTLVSDDADEKKND